MAEPGGNPVGSALRLLLDPAGPWRLSPSAIDWQAVSQMRQYLEEEVVGPGGEDSRAAQIGNVKVHQVHLSGPQVQEMLATMGMCGSLLVEYGFQLEEAIRWRWDPRTGQLTISQLQVLEGDTHEDGI